ncbi:hypothetical protein [Streptomyces sp. NPDC057403]|uniref:hypothetical protein n=1 Tax=Streptomyces sp. NPDC057403 TaxID=3346119 RepID=UPI00368E8EE6
MPRGSAAGRTYRPPTGGVVPVGVADKLRARGRRALTGDPDVPEHPAGAEDPDG